MLSKDLNEYSYVVNSWYVDNGSIIDFPNENIFLNDYLNASSKDRPPKYLVYYFEEKNKSYAYKLKITLDNTTSPITLFQEMKSDQLSCNKRQLANEDFRRQSCYYADSKPNIASVSTNLGSLIDRVKLVIKNKN